MREPAVIQTIPGILLVTATVIIALRSGVLDAKRDYLAAQNERLTIQKEKLEQEKESVAGQMSAEQAKLKIVQRQLAEFQGERDAISQIRELNIESVIEFHNEAKGYKVSFTKPERIGFDPRIPEVADSTIIRPALQRIAHFRKVQELSITGYNIEREDLEIIARVRALTELKLSGSDLTNEKMLYFPIIPNLTSLSLMHQRFSDPGSLADYPNLMILRITDTPLNDEGLVAINTLRRTLNEISLSSTKITDKSIDYLIGCKLIKDIDIVDTGITDDGVFEFVAHVPHKNHITLDCKLKNRHHIDIQRAAPNILALPPIPYLCVELLAFQFEFELSGRLCDWVGGNSLIIHRFCSIYCENPRFYQLTGSLE